ncbi:MAG TPA: hypothetical protein VK112_12705 [Fodinibius sp.]|nr:hypothetical protein [Fodinibius sp.]
MKSLKIKFQVCICALTGLLLVSCSNQPQTDQTEEHITQKSDSSVQRQEKGVGIEVYEKKPFGNYLTDAAGMSLYLFNKDAELHRSVSKSTCYDECAEAWPPVLTSGGNIAAGAKVDTTLLGTTERKNGTTQVTYDGYPLYYYIDDKEPGDVNGHDKNEYGADWYLIKPTGEALEDVGLQGK